MRDKGSSFATVLKEAQQRGYAEADPTFDIEGIDAAHKLTIMSAIAFGVPMQFEKVYTEGISKLTGEDIRYAEELGYRIKLLGHHAANEGRNRAARASDAHSRRNGSSPTSRA
jgi:homoserine dehydrogenase